MPHSFIQSVYDVRSMAPLHTLSMNVIVDCNIIAERKNTHTTRTDYLLVSFIATEERETTTMAKKKKEKGEDKRARDNMR